MKSLSRSIVTIAALAGMLLFTACDWSSGSQNDYNTSGSDGSNVSGFYEGILSGGLAVNRSDWGITHLNVQQSGNTLNVTDNKGSKYTGLAGNGLSSADNTVTGEDGNTTEGTIYYTYQISFTGVNYVTGQEVNFTGYIEIKQESVIVSYVYDDEGNITDYVSEEQTTSTLKGTWIEANGITTTAFAQNDPPDVTTTTSTTSTN
ncbi:hypothetical protein P0Y35_01625 [Kiritimatiellaeota bacterium B1221]|nr:hypothetical protein [Kiritimatiellaeota bacterium B1221]